MGRLPSLVFVSALLLGGPLGAYSLSGHKWSVPDVPLWINPVNADMSESAATTAILNAAAHWSDQSSARIRFYYAGRTSGASLVNNGRNEVFFRNTTNGGLGGSTYYWYGADGRLLDSDTVFYDGGTKFFAGSSGCSGGHYLEDVATHELGHALGLNHSRVTGATMYPTVSVWCSQAWRTLSADDRAGIEAIYPGGTTESSPPSEPAPATAPAAPSNPSPANGATNVQTSTVAWGAASGAASYDVYFGPSTAPPRIAAGVVTTSLSVGQLAQGARYYWRVVARNSVGATSGATWSFTTRAATSKNGNGRGRGHGVGQGAVKWNFRR